MRTITIHFLPSTGLEPETLTAPPGEKAGYHIHEKETSPLGYRLYVGNKTVLVPAAIVHKIETDL